jgi:1,4-alpha-glucan branching enzyme
MVADLNSLYRREPALYEVDFHHTGFEWIDCMNRDDSMLSFLRRAKNPDDFLVVNCNFTPVVREGYRIGVPQGGWYEEIFCSDSMHYGGSNVGNFPGVTAQQPGAQGRPYSIEVRLPPLAISVFKPRSSS